ncbi:hypothetical protein C5167_017462 [Papaver somniferum]|uniref:SHSP domain-containing protein n=1 Tax=Papaver somniferum TaxID=3469 RepID=A0A4Y7IJH1_PAPSO|nr:uncharacterized protein LOC113350803 [Papaver somniferum]RZC49034.1 hypothetical protein C5167_017462 [Papaver somniferum]
MELEIGLKITKTKDDGNFTTSNLRITKDGNGPVFVSSETESMFILTAHLQGYRRERIKIDINEDGTLISISGDKTIQEMVMVRWTMYKKEAEITGFKKAFRIPNGVKLNKIKARFNQEETILSIFMPKLKKGIQGVAIEEVTDVAEEQEEEKVVEEAVAVQENESEKTELESLDMPAIETEKMSSNIEEIPEMVIQENQETERTETQDEEAPGEVVQEPTENERIPELETASVKEKEVEEIHDETSCNEKEEELIEEIVKQEDFVEDTSIAPVEPEEEPLILEHEQQLVEEKEENREQQQLRGEEMQNYDEEESSIENKATSPTNETSPWLRYPFGAPSGFIIGSTLFGLLIALVVHLLSENKKLKKHGTS